jgi:hypothetical protein
MKHGHAGAIPADLRCGNCHSTKTSSGWTWSKLDKDSRLCNRHYKCEKRNQEPRPLTLSNSVDGRTYSNCRANNTSKWQHIDRRSPSLCLHCWYKATHHTLLNYINSAESVGRPNDTPDSSSGHQCNELLTAHIPPSLHEWPSGASSSEPPLEASSFEQHFEPYPFQPSSKPHSF